MQMPTLGKPQRPGVSRLLIPLAFVTAASGGAAWYWHKHRPEPAAPQPPPSAVAEPAPAAVEPPKLAPATVNDEALRQAGVRRISATIDGPLERAIVHQVGPGLGHQLTQVVVRALVWWVAVPADLRRGDTVEALFEEHSGAEPTLVAVRFQSHKAGHTYEAYRFKPASAHYPSLFEADGRELELRLVDGPLDEYEQVTSLLRDGRGHAGVDFKTAVGTPVKAPFDGVVTRRNWNVGANGNCVALHESGGGRTAMFLHLSEVPDTVRVGTRISRGEVLAKSGNTGHSFAPHLHYQLETTAGKILDPFVSHATTRRTLPNQDQATFTAERGRLDNLLDLGSPPKPGAVTPTPTPAAPPAQAASRRGYEIASGGRHHRRRATH
ncbi:MAG TPA: peptidoglycan DD-metalloendopeptidase family protein [Polyangia bacterium]|jgi:murein DD-endopeptidase MepM/ murein hydrolase activator NlpD|nr:peptidoglycan DD-metalloendopeptidase family protein [Polyangia bacterium]